MADSHISSLFEIDGLYFMAVNHYSSPIQSIEPLKPTPKCDGSLGPWRECRHPGGSVYFCRETPKALTRANLSRPDSLKSIEDTLDLIRNKERALAQPLPSDTELVLEQIDAISWGYYYANNETRAVFWLEDCRSHEPHIEPRIHAQYWEHWYWFPNMRDVPQDIIKELRGMALYASGEYIISPTFKHLATPQDLEKILALMDHIQKPDLNPSNYLAATVGRFMRVFAIQQFFDRNKTAPLKRSSLSLKIFSPLLLYAPDYMFRELDRIIIDKRVNDNDWVSFVDECRSQWSAIVLNATVFLTANLAFLAIPLVNQGQGLNSSVAQVASYISAAASIGALIMGAILITREIYKAAPRPTLPRIQSIAIVYALPHTLLLWSLLSFLIAFLSMTLSGTSTVTRILVCLACLVFFTPIVLSVIWSIRVRSFQE